MRIITIRVRKDGVFAFDTRNWHELDKIFGAELEWIYISKKFRARVHKNLLR